MPAFFKLCSVGGTFNSFHRGHKEYLEIAFSVAQKVHIYLSSQEYALLHKPYIPKTYEQRLQQILNYLKSKNLLSRAEIFIIESNTSLEAQIFKTGYDVAVVEPAYFEQFKKISLKKSRNNKKPFAIVLKPRTQDNRRKDISSTQMQLKMYRTLKEPKYSTA